MKNEHRAITALGITALLLVLAIIFIPAPADAQVSMKDGDYLIVTYPVAGAAGDGLYIVDTRLGVLSIFVYDNNAKRLEMRAARQLSDAFQVR